jgi:hypothetical protein
MGIGIHCTVEKVVPQLVHRTVAILTDIIKDFNLDVNKGLIMNSVTKNNSSLNDVIEDFKINDVIKDFKMKNVIRNSSLNDVIEDFQTDEFFLKP